MIQNINLLVSFKAVFHIVSQYQRFGLLMFLFSLVCCHDCRATQEPLRITIGYLPDTAITKGTFVISRAAIQASQAATVGQLLERVAGIHVEQAASAGSVSSVFIRGADPNFTVVLIDGVKVNDPTNSRGGSFDFASLSIDEVESIEISRAALSAVYGSDAISGVISIRTRPQTSINQASLTFGDHRTYRLSARTSRIGATTDYGVAVVKNDDGQAIFGQRSRREAGNAYFRQQINDQHIVDVQARYASGKHQSFPDDSGGQVFAVLRTQDKRENDATTLALSYQYKPGPFWDIYAKYDYFNQREKVDSPGVAPGIRDAQGIPANAFKNDFNRHRLLIYGDARLSAGIEVVAGLEYTREDGSSEGNLDFGFFQLGTDFMLQRNNRAAFVEVHFKPARHFDINTSYRIDNPDGFASSSNARIALQYGYGNTRIHFQAGQGFKLPSFFALGHPIVGNAGLSPETANNTEFGIEYKFLHFAAELQLQVFRNVIHNLVDLQETPVLQLVNRDMVILQGGEAELALRITNNLRLTLQASYVDTDIKNSDEKLRSRPRWRGGGTLAWHINEKTFLDLHAEYVGSRFDSSIPTGDVTLGDYIRTDVALNYRMDAKTTYHISVNNLFNTAYETAAGFVAIPRQLSAGVRVNF